MGSMHFRHEKLGGDGEDPNEGVRIVPEQQDLKTFVAGVTTWAVEHAKQTGGVPALLFLSGEKADGCVPLEHILGEPGDARHERFRMAGAGVASAQGRETLGDLRYVVQLSEAWGVVESTAKYARGDRRQYQDLAHHPRRVEVLFVAGFDPNSGESVMNTYRYVRERDNDEASKLLDVVPLRGPKGEPPEEGAVVDDDQPDPKKGVRPYLLEAFVEGFNGYAEAVF